MSALLYCSITSDSGLFDLVKLPEENQKGVMVVWKILVPLCSLGLCTCTGKTAVRKDL